MCVCVCVCVCVRVCVCSNNGGEGLLTFYLGIGDAIQEGYCHPGGNAIRMYGGCAIPLRVVIICQKLVWIDLKLKVK